MNKDISSLRKDYQKGLLDEIHTPPTPFPLFSDWFNHALEHADIDEPTAMTLATLNEKMQPQARIVLLKDWSEKGFTFFTNYQSQKGKALQQHPKAALLFFWSALERQIRIEGKVEKVEKALSEQYFHSRPLDSQIGAWSSPQSQIIPNRTVLEDNVAKYSKAFDSKEIPLPEHWGGFRLVPTSFEFWQGRSNRLHDRIEYVLDGNQWQKHRLAP
jgi:pyridoxamine 5'-phosphate oxidase